VIAKRCSAFLILALALAQAASPTSDAEKTARDLAAIRAEIDRVNAAMSRDAAQRDRLARELKSAEQSVSGARTQLERLRVEREERTARRAQLALELHERETSLEHERAVLAGQMRAAYLIGREEPLKLLLNQKDPARAGRMFAYYAYFGRARAEEIGRIELHVKQLDELDRALAAEEDRLAALEADRKSELARLEQARAQRRTVLADLQAQTRSRAESLERLQRQQEGLEKLLRELRRAIVKFPSDRNDAFAKLRGELAWPVTGRVVAGYGETRIGGVRWDGMLVATERGAPVRAVYQGRVIYADWLSGLGLLVIVDHGDGYLSLYGHNERLFKTVGDRVAAGEPIAAAGDSGGRARPELYFEIRRGGRPVDPRPWFRSSAPPGR
jgi:septal ring factor EnvC (AmiA/AmiB activator)